MISAYFGPDPDRRHIQLPRIGRVRTRPATLSWQRGGTGRTDMTLTLRCHSAAMPTSL